MARGPWPRRGVRARLPAVVRRKNKLHPEAADWAARVVQNGGTVGESLPAVSAFCRAIDAAGIRSKLLRVNLFCGGGGTTNAFLVPLYLGSSISHRIGGTLDTNSGGLFVSGDYNETGASGGLTGGGTRYITTGLLTSALPAIATGHIAAYVMTGFAAASAYGLVVSFASGFAGSNYYGIEANAGNVTGTFSGSWGSSFSGRAQVTSANGAGIGFIATSRTASDDNRLYRNGSQIGTTQTATATPVANDGAGFGVFASLAQTGSATFYAPVRMGGYSIGTGLTAAEMSSYNTAMQAFQTALLRNV